jgi:hypothetical protein
VGPADNSTISICRKPIFNKYCVSLNSSTSAVGAI